MDRCYCIHNSGVLRILCICGSPGNRCSEIIYGVKKYDGTNNLHGAGDCA